MSCILSYICCKCNYLIVSIYNIENNYINTFKYIYFRRLITKRKVFSLSTILFILFLIIFSSTNISAVKEGLQVWVNAVIPSLFPFFIATEMLNFTNIAHALGKVFNKIMIPLFNVPGKGAYALIMGIISGYPVGAKIVLDIYQNGKCSKDEAERMLVFTNNSGPLFIIGTVGIISFRNKEIGILLLITHILASLSVGILLGICSRINKNNRLNIKWNKINTNMPHNIYNNSITDLGTILSISIKKAISNILQIGGFIVLFSVILSMLNRLNIFDYVGTFSEYFFIPKYYTKIVLSGLIELTNGVTLCSCFQVKYLSLNIVLCAFLLGFGGISILLQVISIISESNLSSKTYVYGKLLHGLFASLYTAILIRIMPIYNLDIELNSSNHILDKIICILLSIIVAYATIMIKTRIKLNHKRNKLKYNL